MRRNEGRKFGGDIADFELQLILMTSVTVRLLRMFGQQTTPFLSCDTTAAFFFEVYYSVLAI
jgi:hypothetical protein